MLYIIMSFDFSSKALVSLTTFSINSFFFRATTKGWWFWHPTYYNGSDSRWIVACSSTNSWIVMFKKFFNLLRSPKDVPDNIETILKFSEETQHRRGRTIKSDDLLVVSPRACLPICINILFLKIIATFHFFKNTSPQKAIAFQLWL